LESAIVATGTRATHSRDVNRHVQDRPDLFRLLGERFMMLRLALILTATWLALTQMAEAGPRHRHSGCTTCSTNCATGCSTACGTSCASTEPQYVEKTVMVPQTVWETKMVTKTVCRPETRESTYKVCKRVPETNV